MKAQLVIEDGHRVLSPAISIITTVPGHIVELKANLRQEDAEEILRLGVTVPKALWYSYKHSLIRKTALIDGVVAACWGLGGIFLGKVGQPWLMTTPEIKRVSSLKFARIYQQEVIEMLKLFPKLENYVDAEYAGAVRLLEIIGFTVQSPESFGTGGMYRKFEMVR